MIRILVTFLAVVASALALPTHFVDTLQAIFGVSSSTLDLPKPEIGWADPRLNGGRFLDVSPSCTKDTILVSFHCSLQLPDMGNP